MNNRQEQFCNFVAQGHTVSEAYKLAGYKSKWIRESSYHLRNIPKVKARIEELQNKRIADVEKNYKLTKENLIGELGKIIYGSAKDRDRISAIQVAAKLMGLDFNINANIDLGNMKPEDMDLEELQKYVNSLKGAIRNDKSQ